MKKRKIKSTVKPFRVPLMVQKNRVFKSVRDYDRKNKNWKKDSGSFSFI